MTQQLSPKALGEAIGVSESSLKRWTDQGLLRAVRTAGGHRRIELNEAVRFIREQGFTVQHPEILGFPALRGFPRSASPGAAFEAALAEGRNSDAHNIVANEYLAGVPAARLLDEVVAPAMRAFGHPDPVPAEAIFREHRATEICLQILDRIRTLQSREHQQAVALTCAPGQDLHGLPSAMAAVVLAEADWRVVNLAACTPIGALAEAAYDTDAALVCLAVSAGEPAGLGINVGSEVRRALTTRGIDATLIIGGPAAGAYRGPAGSGYVVADSFTDLARLAHEQRLGKAV